MRYTHLLLCQVGYHFLSLPCTCYVSLPRRKAGQGQGRAIADMLHGLTYAPSYLDSGCFHSLGAGIGPFLSLEG